VQDAVLHGSEGRDVVLTVLQADDNAQGRRKGLPGRAGPYLWHGAAGPADFVRLLGGAAGQDDCCGREGEGGAGGARLEGESDDAGWCQDVGNVHPVGGFLGVEPRRHRKVLSTIPPSLRPYAEEGTYHCLGRV